MLLIAVFCGFIGATGAIARMSMLSYYLIYVAGAFTVIAPTFTIISLMQMVGNLVLPFATRKLGKVRTFVIFEAVNALSMLVLFLAPQGNVVILLGLSVIYGFTNAGSSICYSMICDSIEYGDWKYGVRDDALAFSVMSLGVKCATAITGAVGVLLLAAMGYVAGEQQSPETQTGINVIVNLIPAILVGISVAIMKFYKLNEKTMDGIMAELKARRAGQGEGVYADWLRKRGPGLHHIKFETADRFDTVMDTAKEISGRPPYLMVSWPDGRPLVAYADLLQEAGLLIEVGADVEEKAVCLRKRFILDAVPERAYLYATARGVYSISVNGVPVSDLFAPGYTSYAARLEYQCYDVSSLLRRGENVIAATLADGWYTGKIGAVGIGQQYGTENALLFQLELRQGGNWASVYSDGEVRFAPSPWKYADLFVGSCYDESAALPGWDAPGYDDSGWLPVRVRDYGTENLCLQSIPPVREERTIVPRRFTAPNGDVLLDAGETVVGYVSFNLFLKAGDTVKLEHSEVLDAAGNFMQNIVGQNRPAICRSTLPPPAMKRTWSSLSATGWGTRGPSSCRTDKFPISSPTSPPTT